MHIILMIKSKYFHSVGQTIWTQLFHISKYVDMDTTVQQGRFDVNFG